MLATDTGGTARLSLFKFCVFRDWVIMRVGDQCVCLSKIAMLMAKLGSVFGSIHSQQLSAALGFSEMKVCRDARGPGKDM